MCWDQHCSPVLGFNYTSDANFCAWSLGFATGTSAFLHGSRKVSVTYLWCQCDLAVAVHAYTSLGWYSSHDGIFKSCLNFLSAICRVEWQKKNENINDDDDDGIHIFS